MSGDPVLSLSSETLRTEVLVIGGGAAGLRAALSAAESEASVLLVSNPPPAGGGSSFRNLSGGWGIQALVEEERTEAAMEAFDQDILRVGLGQADPVLSRILVEESGPRLLELMRMGIRFRRREGVFLRVRGCFSRSERAFLTERMDNVRQAFLSAIRRSSVKTITGDAIQLLMSDGACWGAWVADSAGRLLRVVSPATILTTGGGAGIYARRLVAPSQVGTGYALAKEAGATLRNMEFVQFMLVLEQAGNLQFFPLARLDESGQMSTEQGRDLLDAYLPPGTDRTDLVEARKTHHPFSTRDDSRHVDLAVAQEIARGGGVFWSTPENMVGHAGPQGVAHACHAFNGGIRIDAQGESDLPGLFAAGETAAGPHGADRIGGCMMTATQVFGDRAGRFAAQRARRQPAIPEKFSEPDLATRWGPKPTGKARFSDLETRSEACFEARLGILRHAAGLRECLEQVRALRLEADEFTWHTRSDLARLHRLHCRLSVGEAVAQAALDRTCILGSHWRADTA